jgi:hypothetical protein
MGRLQRALARCLVEIHGAAEHAGSAQLAHRRASAGDGLWLLALSICACVVFLGLLVGAPRASGADEVDANCKVCQQRGEACLTETDANGIRTFHGCCGGIICPGPFLGGTVSVCCNTGVCNVTTGHCVAQCPAGTSLCHDSTCTPDCSPPQIFEPVSCKCVTPCQAGQAQCGSSCCPAGQACAAPQAGSFTMHCCPTGRMIGVPRKFNGACGDICMDEVRKEGGVCCRRGPMVDPNTGSLYRRSEAFPKRGEACCGGDVISLRFTMCCGGNACRKAFNQCINGQCVPNLIPREIPRDR